LFFSNNSALSVSELLNTAVETGVLIDMHTILPDGGKNLDEIYNGMFGNLPKYVTVLNKEH
jgi:hypothetical protein